MASWHYAFLFPSANGGLNPSAAVDVLSDFGLEFDKSARAAVEIDELGHLEYGEETPLGPTAMSELKRRLTDQEQLMIECRNSELFFSCSFATRYANPYMMFGWSKRLFRELPQSRQDEYWEMLRQCAKQGRAAHIVIVDDPPDFFEDRFLEIDGQRFLENQMPSGNKYDIHRIWTNVELCDKTPEGVDESSRRVMPDGFVEYTVANGPPQQTT
jgi:hypothetical protein